MERAEHADERKYAQSERNLDHDIADQVPYGFDLQIAFLRLEKPWRQPHPIDGRNGRAGEMDRTDGYQCFVHPGAPGRKSQFYWPTRKVKLPSVVCVSTERTFHSTR